MRHLVLIGIVLGLAAIHAGPVVALDRAVDATISAADEMPGSVGYVTHSGTDVINAQIGRWDTPYPYPDTGKYAPGLQPTGYSSFAIVVDVNDGGLASFRYRMQTYDAGKWDWFDIFMETPTGTVPIVDHLGKPGSQYGTYWRSPTVTTSQSLDTWRDQRVCFIFRVMQDGWGDQTVGELFGFSLNTCDIPPLTPITDPAAIAFENGNRVVTQNLTQATLTGLACMRSRVTALGGSMPLSSAYRPVAYQDHLREVWDTWDAVHNRQETECQAVRDVALAEFQSHHLLRTQRPAAGNPNAPHARGIAIDATLIDLPAGETQDTVAAFCGMYRPWPANDRVHYQPQ
ncbi:MAG: hypothetical protein OEV64_07900 [Desulfobulbaceae bacterium]|nr:hypothetical protein [Desulfobulbaceae bacterium]